MKLAAALLLACLVSASYAGERSRVLRAEFQRLNPCPSTGKSRGACPGFHVDHIQPLCANGADRLDNLQWLSHEAHKDKTRRDVAACRGVAYKPPSPKITKRPPLPTGK